MSKRNFILLILILIIVTAAVFGFFYSRKNTNTVGNETEGTNFFDQFNPFGTSTNTPAPTAPTVDVSTPTEGEPTEQIPDVNLKRVSSMPVAGFAVFQKERPIENNPSSALPLSGEGVTPVPPAKGGSGGLKPKTEFAPALRYVDRALGSIYQTFADNLAEVQFSGPIMPKVYEAYFGAKAESVVMRHLKGDERTIETFVGALPKEVPPPSLPLNNGEENVENKIYEVKGIFLPENITDLSLSTDATKIFYLFNSGDIAIGTTFGLSDKKKVQVLDTPFTEWNSLWPNSKIITLTTKPSSGVLGYMYTLDPTTKKLTKTLGGVNGLTTLMSPNGKLVLYSDSGLSLYVYDVAKGTSSTAGVRTLAEKCVWNKNSDAVYCAMPKIVESAAYPDAWYQGEISFSDEIWKIDVKTGNTTMILDPVAVLGGVRTDAIKLALDEKEDYLFFVNKKDSYLWQFKLR